MTKLSMYAVNMIRLVWVLKHLRWFTRVKVVSVVGTVVKTVINFAAGMKCSGTYL